MLVLAGGTELELVPVMGTQTEPVPGMGTAGLAGGGGTDCAVLGREIPDRRSRLVG